MADPASNIRTMPTLVPALTAYSRTVASVVAERVAWVWPGRLAAGKLTIIDGDPGLGKSTMAPPLDACVWGRTAAWSV